MGKIRLGRTNLMVSKIGFGGIPIQRLTDDAAIKLVKTCFELG
jgi:aryl-alcohol dehydrogenase-like predicted oxidoreductase